MSIRKPSHPEAGEVGAVEYGSDAWKQAQAEGLRKWGQLAGLCHPWVPAMEVGVYLLSEDQQSVRQIGLAWVCAAQDWNRRANRTDYCYQPVANGGRTMKAFKTDWPQDFTQDLWDDMKQVGPQIHGKGRFGYYCIRGLDQELKAYAPEGRKIAWAPRQEDLKIDGKVPSHGYARDQALKHNAYEPDPVEWDAQEPF